VRPSVAIAGSGVAGLACAAAIGRRADAIVVERLPVAGGERWQEPLVARLVAEARAAGARFLLGTQAVRWDGRHVLALGQESAVLDADALVVATGHRPFTRAELGIVGPRCGGIVPATVALHLVHHRVVLGRSPVVVGGSREALGLARRIGASVVAPSGLDDDPGVPAYEGARPLRVEGFPRVTALLAELADGRRFRLWCDALVLAEGRVPYRNVDGAVLDGPALVFAQPGGRGRDDAVTEAAGRAAAELALPLAAEERVQQDLELRIGGPKR
jgi:hypothetical protein